MAIKEKELIAVRQFYFPKGENISLDDLKEGFQKTFEELQFPSIIQEETVSTGGLLGKEFESFSVFHNEKRNNYIGFNFVLFMEKRQLYLQISAYGKGEQVKPKDLIGFMRKLQAESSVAANVYNRFGQRKSVAVGYVAGRALSGGVNLMIKGIKVALRDREAYEKEMGYYNDFLLLCDELLSAEA
ncbi:hypothetical protein [Zhenpiania hominis]|uniref:hypothetical protein n=1 Tax=Zhenpiania hominis TaxID=2763644 RepID=UPI0039F5C30E